MRIAFACHPSGGRPWSPEAAAAGIGGSEEAVIRMAAGLATRGHQVSVHMRGGVDRSFGGVAYDGWDSLRGARIDVLVTWRRASLSDPVDERAAHVGRRYLWLHDAWPSDDLEARLSSYDGVLLLSQFQRNCHPQVPDHQVVLTSNGIDPAEFAPPHPWRDPHLVVYGSDYNRGLRAVLTGWAEVRAAVPDARLHVFYGWQGLARRSPERAARLKAIFEPLLGQPGVSHLGRIGHAAVVHEYRTAGVWAYPCSFPETSCLSAMKAQAGGAVPVVIPTGALRQTVRFGLATDASYTDPGDDLDGPALVTAWRQLLISLLADPERQRRIRRRMTEESRRLFAWGAVVDQWEEEFAR